MKNWKARILFSAAWVALVLAGYWIAGGEFVRGSEMFVAYLGSLIVAYFSATSSLFDD